MTRRGGQNRSSAVMQQRQEARDSLDDFPTQPWGTRAFVEHVLFPLLNCADPDADPAAAVKAMTAWEPACNRGYMVRPLREYFGRVHASDVHDYSDEWPLGTGWDARVCDFLWPGSHEPFTAAGPIDWIITNPPFRLALQFIRRGLEVARGGVAVLVRSAFTEGIERYETLFRETPPTVIAQYAERLPLVRGKVDPDAQSATAYSWLAWQHGAEPQPFRWIPPCRRRLERPGDYPPKPVTEGSLL